MSFVLLVIYFIILSYSLTKWEWVSRSGIKKEIIIILFGVKILVGFALVVLYSTYYDKESSDIYIYFNDARYLKQLFLNNRNVFWNLLLDHNEQLIHVQKIIEPIQYWNSSSVDFVIHEKRIVILLNFFFSFISLDNIYIHSMLMAFIGFVGQIAIFRFVRTQSKIDKVLVLIVSFLLPTFLLWSSSILKEPLIIFSLGLLLFFVGKWAQAWKYKYLLGVFIFYTMGIFIKPYVIFTLSFPLLIFVVFKYKNKLNFKKQSLIVFGSFILIIFAIWVLTFVDINLFEKLSDKQSAFYQTIELAEQTGAVGSQLVINKLNPSLLSFIYNSPSAFVNVMFKPGVYDFKNLLYLPDILQNLLIMLIGILLVFKYKKADKNTLPFIWLSLLFFIILYVIIGLVTPVLGAIVRYKIPAIIFVFFFLLSFLKMNFNNKTVLKFIFHSSN